MGTRQAPKHPIFDYPYSFLTSDIVNSPNSLLKTPTCLLQKTINLSFSQPSSPRTPAFGHKGSHVLGRGTPCVGSVSRKSFPFDAMLLTTPMLIRTLDSIQAEGKETNNPYPDILQLIDTDDSNDQHWQREMTDDHITDWVLDLSQEYNHQVPAIQTVETNKPAQVSIENKTTKESSPRIYKRKQRRTKPMTEEERQTLQRLKQQKSRQKSKNKNISVPVTGTRKSSRIRRSVVRF